MLWLLCFLATLWPGVGAMRPGRIAKLRQETVDMFYHGYDNYMKLAFPEDEVRFHVVAILLPLVLILIRALATTAVLCATHTGWT